MSEQITNRIKIVNANCYMLLDTLIVDFVNYVGTRQGLDWGGLYTKHLYEENKPKIKGKIK